MTVGRWRMKQWILIAASPLALFLAVVPANALNPDVRISQYAHTAWRLKDGAFSGTPNAVTQTADGYIWIATDAGLVKFDGVRFVPWQPPAGQKLPSSAIYSLLGTRDGTLWIGTAVGLARWKDNTLVNFLERARVESIRSWKTMRGEYGLPARGCEIRAGGLCQVVRQDIQCVGGSNGMDLPTRCAACGGQPRKPLDRQRQPTSTLEIRFMGLVLQGRTKVTRGFIRSGGHCRRRGRNSVGRIFKKGHGAATTGGRRLPRKLSCREWTLPICRSALYL